MTGFTKNTWVERFACLLVALLISNVLAVSCAIALALCSDCPVETPAHCVEMCEVEATVSTEDLSKKTTDHRPPVAYSEEIFPNRSSRSSECIFGPTFDLSSTHSPPLNVLYCVYLK
jgi:hypothetical protein